jgi:hypothetical protein
MESHLAPLVNNYDEAKPSFQEIPWTVARDKILALEMQRLFDQWQQRICDRFDNIF